MNFILYITFSKYNKDKMGPLEIFLVPHTKGLMAFFSGWHPPINIAIGLELKFMT